MRRSLLVLACMVAGCSSSSSSPSATANDASAAHDSGGVDAGAKIDSGSMNASDAGDATGTNDATVVDSGSIDDAADAHESMDSTTDAPSTPHDSGPPADAAYDSASNADAGFSVMAPPSYSGSTWTVAERTHEEDFASLANWNYGFTDTPTSGSSGGYTPWGESGSSPYWGSVEGQDGVLDYDLPGNVYQTSTGANATLYGTYTPQVFNASGHGVSITAHYTGSKVWHTGPYPNLTETWTSGAINTFNKISFPSSGYTSCYVQISAQMMGYMSSDNGAWNALWFLGQGNSDREIDLQETGLSDQSPNWIIAHLQSPAASVASTKTASDLSAGYHVYGMELANQVVKIYLDNVLMGTRTSNTSGPYFLLINGAIASGEYGAAPAHNTDMTMNVAEVQVYQR